MFRKNLSYSKCQIKAESGEFPTFSGYAATFGGVDSYGDTIAPGAFANTLSEHGLPKMFFNHDGFDLPVGKYLDAYEDETGLYVTGEMTAGNSRAEDVHASLTHGTVDGLSIGYYLGKGDYEETDKGRVIHNVKRLVEVSVVMFPADNHARIDLQSVKAEEIDQIETVRDFERFLRDAGGVSRRLANALVSRAAIVFREGEPRQDEIDAKAEEELRALGERLKSFSDRVATAR